jgi:tripartite ATP-independent transporter DctP family solute receptor
MKNLMRLAALATAIVLAISLAGCSGGQKATSGNQSAGSADQDKSYVIKFGHGSAESNARHKAALKFKEIVESKTNGKVKVEVYPNEVLGSEREMLESVQLNNIQMTAGGTGIFAGFYPKIGVIELPYIFDNFEQAWKVLDGPLGQELAEPLKEKGIHILAYWENGFRQVTNNVRPINKPEDLKGIKIRTPEIPVSLSIFKALGANPTAMPFGELYMALQQKTVDGQENPLTNIYASKFYEVQKYLSLTKHQYSPLPLAISEEFWKSLPKEYQDIIQEAANQARDYHRSLIQEDDQQLVGELKNKGMQVNVPPDLMPFREAVKSVYKEFEGTYGADLIKKLQDAAGASR